MIHLDLLKAARLTTIQNPDTIIIPGNLIRVVRVMSTSSIQTADQQITNSNLTTEMVDALCEIISHGHFRIAACNVLRINYTTFQRWMRVGKNDPNSGIYRELYERILQAESASELFAGEAMRKHFDRDPKIALAFLERKFPDRWSQRKYVNIQVEKEVTSLLRELEARLPAETFAILQNELTAIANDTLSGSGVEAEDEESEYAE